MNSQHYRRWFVGLLCVACLLRLIMMIAQPMSRYKEMSHKHGDEQFYVAIAHTLVYRHEFIEGNLKAYRPPLYPAFIAAVMLIDDDARALQIAQNALFVLAIALFIRAVTLTSGRKVGLLSGALLAANPLWLTLPQEAYSETLFVFLLALALYTAVALRQHPSPLWALVMGSLLGLSALTREVGLFFGAAVIFVTVFTPWQKAAPRSPAFLACLGMLGMMATVLPWTVRNYLVFRRIVPITTNGTINFYIGNNPDADGRFSWHLPLAAQRLWNTPSAHGWNEIEVARLAGHAAFDYASRHPERTVLLSLKKFWLFWKPGPVGAFSLRPETLLREFRFFSWLPYLGFGCYGLWRMRREYLGRLILLVLCIGTAVHMATFSDLRFRSTYEFFLAAPAAFALVRLLDGAALARPVRMREVQTSLQGAEG